MSETIRATLYDGATAYPHEVHVKWNGERLTLVTAHGHGEQVAPELLVPEDGVRRLSRTDRPGWRLSFLDQPPTGLVEHLPGAARYGRWIDRFGLGRAALGFSALAALVVAGGYAAPAVLAPQVPEAWERNLGDAIVGDFGQNRCPDASGNAALKSLVERVSPGVDAGPHAIAFAALDFRIVNAVAVPGNHVILFDGMLRQARSGDELAGVLAHEIAHVRRRHVTEALLRELGIGALIRLFTGTLGANAQQLIGLSYTRSNEKEADGDAVLALAKAGIDPRPTAALFRRLDPSEKKMKGGEWLQSHPNGASRAVLFANSYRPAVAYRPAMSAAAFEQLRRICDGDGEEAVSDAAD